MWVLRLRLRCSPRLPSRSAESMESTGSRTATSPSDACARPSRASACALYPARALIPAGCLRRTRAQREGKACWPIRVRASARFGEESLDSFLKFRCAIEKVTRGVATRGRSASQSVVFPRTRALLSRRLKTNTSPRCVAFDRSEFSSFVVRSSLCLWQVSGSNSGSSEKGVATP